MSDMKRLLSGAYILGYSDARNDKAIDVIGAIERLTMNLNKNDLISRQDAIRESVWLGVNGNYYEVVSVDDLKKLPSAERTGKWISDWNRKIKMIDGCPDGSCHCSNCGEWLVASDEYAVKGIYCPNCGAKMETEEKNDHRRLRGDGNMEPFEEKEKEEEKG